MPQSLALLDAGGIVPTPEMRERLAAIEYERCLAVRPWLGGPLCVRARGGLTPDAGPRVEGTALSGWAAAEAILTKHDDSLHAH